MIRDSLSATAVLIISMALRSAFTAPHTETNPMPAALPTIAEPPASMTPAATVSEQDAGTSGTTTVASFTPDAELWELWELREKAVDAEPAYSEPTAYTPDSILGRLDSLEAEVARLSHLLDERTLMPAPAAEPKYTQPQKPKAVPVRYVPAVNYSSCGPNGCGRRGLFGRRR